MNATLLAQVNAGEVPEEFLTASEQFMRISQQVDRSTPSERSTDTRHSSKRALSKQKAPSPERGSETRAQLPRPSNPKQAADALKKTTAFIEKTGVVTGAYFGAVFSVTGDRIGAGFIGGNAQEIIVKPTQAVQTQPSGRKKHRVYVGRLQEGWGFEESGEEMDPEPKGKGKGRPQTQRQRQYIGDPSVLFRRKIKTTQELSSLTPLTVTDELPPSSYLDPSSWSSADAEGEDDDEDEGANYWIMNDVISSSPVRPPNDFSQEQMSMIVAKALEAVRLDIEQT
jgi:hypothetical protein